MFFVVVCFVLCFVSGVVVVLFCFGVGGCFFIVADWVFCCFFLSFFLFSLFVGGCCLFYLFFVVVCFLFVCFLFVGDF